MPFGTKNAPAFYTVMMNFLRDDWILSFNETKHNVSFDHSSTKIICDDRIIIDDILLFSNHIPTLLHYFPVLHKECTKYRLSFQISKFDFFKDRVEYVGYDLTTEGYYLAVSKFTLLQDWTLPPHGIYFVSLIGICCFYNMYCHWFETNIKPLRKLQRNYHCKDSVKKQDITQQSNPSPINNHVKQQNIKQQSNPSHISNHVQYQPRLFPLNLLPLHFRCIIGIDLTYHHHIYQSVDNLIATVIPLIRLYLSHLFI